MVGVVGGPSAAGVAFYKVSTAASAGNGFAKPVPEASVPLLVIIAQGLMTYIADGDIFAILPNWQLMLSGVVDKYPDGYTRGLEFSHVLGTLPESIVLPNSPCDFR
jgi:hypothetical protein